MHRARYYDDAVMRSRLNKVAEPLSCYTTSIWSMRQYMIKNVVDLIIVPNNRFCFRNLQSRLLIKKTVSSAGLL